ncbi:MAG: hypothetical protein QCH34_06080 [Methanocalculus sp.]|nr:hypothetical protein [Methanocalculus sp.]
MLFFRCGRKRGVPSFGCAIIRTCRAIRLVSDGILCAIPSRTGIVGSYLPGLWYSGGRASV